MIRPRLVAEGLGKRFGSRLLFRCLSFELNGGDVLTITGANGSGKSTLLRVLAGVLRPSAGSAALYSGGRRIASDIHPLHVGLVSPDLNLYEDLTARENLTFLASARIVKPRTERLGELLERVRLQERADERVRTYSTGMKQRLKLAAALLADPHLMLLDEPAVNLDAEGRMVMARVVASIRDAGKLAVVATNRSDDASLAGRTLCVQDYC